MELATSFTKDLPAKLTPEEVTTRSDTLARTIEEIADVETEKGKVSRQFAEKLKGLKLRSVTLAHAVSNHEENRPVLCSERADMRRFQVETYRHDTSEIVDTRAMTQDEVEEARQTNLFGGVRVNSDAKPKAKGGLDLTSPSGDAEPSPVPSESVAETGATITDPAGVLGGDFVDGKPKRGRKNGLRVVDSASTKATPEGPTAEEVALANLDADDLAEGDDDV